MMRGGVFSLILMVFVFLPLFSQSHEQWNHSYVIRGEVFVELEPIYAGHVDDEYPLEMPVASRRALEEASMFYSAMIYGWSFNYEVGEAARNIKEKLELEPVGLIEYGDPSLRVTDTETRDMRFRMWTDYHLSEAQQRRMQTWNSGLMRSAQAVGYAPSGMDEYPGWLALRKSTLEDAARAALLASLRKSERNRPKEVNGVISLASFPRYFMDGGRLAVAARFRVQIAEIIPFSVY